MRTRSTVARMAELTRWMKKNKGGTRKQFIAETGGTEAQYYKIKSKLGFTPKSPKLSEAMKQVALRRKAKIAQAPKATEPTQDDLEFVSKETVVTEGITPDFIWYEMDLMQRKISDISGRLGHVMKVCQSRDADQKKMMRELITENTELRVNNSSLKQQVNELTEMINGTPV